MLHCSLLLTSCLRILTKRPQQLHKTTSRSLSAIAELLVLRQYLHKNITSEQRKTTRSDFDSDLDKLQANTTPSPLLVVPVHPSTVSVPITVLHTHKRKYMHIAQPKKTIHHQHHYYHNTPLLYTSQSPYTTPLPLHNVYRETYIISYIQYIFCTNIN